MKNALICVFAAGALAACSRDVPTVSGTPQGVTVRYEGGQVADATNQADRFCSALDKRAALQSVTTDGDDNLALFNCY